MNDAIVSGMIMVTGAASALTGGAAASGGETVVTGDSSASVQVTNVINANNDGGTTHTIVEKTINGVKEVTEETKNFAPGEPVEVNVTAEARAEGSGAATDSEITTEAEVVETTDASSTEEELSKAGWSFGSYVRDRISNIVSSFFVSVWSWWNS